MKMINIPGHCDGLCAVKLTHEDGHYVLLFSDGSNAFKPFLKLPILRFRLINASMETVSSHTGNSCGLIKKQNNLFWSPFGAILHCKSYPFEDQNKLFW